MGVYCKNGHFDDPAARYCAICGISMAQQTLIPRRGPRPPLGVLVLDDGSIYTLDTDYIIGRDPSRDPDVIAGTARPLRIDDPEGLLSRVHARIHLEGWSVELVDLGSGERHRHLGTAGHRVAAGACPDPGPGQARHADRHRAPPDALRVAPEHLIGDAVVMTYSRWPCATRVSIEVQGNLPCPR